MTLPIVLASSSPRRKDLLEKIGLKFTIDPSTTFEEFPAEKYEPKELVMKNAEGKAQEVAQRHPNALVIGVDTIGVFENHILEKPHDADDARRMLKLLSGETHEVLSGVSLVHAASGQTHSFVESTRITFHELSDQDIENYLQKADYLDKAAAYAAQGLAALFIQGFEGDFNNVVGLPLARLNKELTRFDINLLDIVE